jgi:hypothetical protein
VRRVRMAVRIYDRALRALQCTMAPAPAGAFLPGLPCADLGSVQDRVYMTAGRMLAHESRLAGIEPWNVFRVVGRDA